MKGRELRQTLFVLDNISKQELLEENFHKKEKEIFEFYEPLTEEKIQILLDEFLH